MPSKTTLGQVYLVDGIQRLDFWFKIWADSQKTNRGNWFQISLNEKTDFGQSRDQILLVPWQLKFCDWRDIYETQQVYFVGWLGKKGSRKYRKQVLKQEIRKKN